MIYFDYILQIYLLGVLDNEKQITLIFSINFFAFNSASNDAIACLNEL